MTHSKHFRSYIVGDIVALGDGDGFADFHQNHFANGLSEGHLEFIVLCRKDCTEMDKLGVVSVELY